MTKEIYKYPYNVRREDEVKVFLSDIICQQVIKIYYKNGLIFCSVKDKVTSNNKEIILSVGIIFALLFSMSLDARLNKKLEFNQLQESNTVILARNNSSSPTIRPGLANGFSSPPRGNRPAGAMGLQPAPSPPLKAPRGFIGRRPQTGAGRQQTKLSGGKNPAAGSNPGAGGNPGAGASLDDQCVVSKEDKSQEPSIDHYDSTKKSKKKKNEMNT